MSDRRMIADRGSSNEQTWRTDSNHGAGSMLQIERILLCGLFGLWRRESRFVYLSIFAPHCTGWLNGNNYCRHVKKRCFAYSALPLTIFQNSGHLAFQRFTKSSSNRHKNLQSWLYAIFGKRYFTKPCFCFSKSRFLLPDSANSASLEGQRALAGASFERPVLTTKLGLVGTFRRYLRRKY